MQFTTFVRKPFVVEAVEITEDNIEELSKYVGELKHKDDGTPFIAVDRRLVPNVYRVFPGFFITRMDDRYRCYNPKTFKQQFVANTSEISAWVQFMNGDASDETPNA